MTRDPRRAVATAAAVVLAAATAALAAGPTSAAAAAAAPAADPGFAIELDSARGELRARDLRSGEDGPVLRVAVGSPAHPTPRGRFRMGRVILRPTWTPSDFARSAGAQREAASLGSPMGVAKIPFANGGAIALHGGGDPDVLGKPVSGGCVRVADADLLRLIAWLELQDALAPPRRQPSGEVVRDLWRTVRFRVR